MAQALKHSFEDGILTIELIEEYSMAEFLEGLEYCFNYYAPDAPIGILIDATHSQSNRSLDEIRGYMSKFKQWKGKVVRFSVLVSSDFLFGLTNQTGAYAQMSGLDVRPFRDRDEAIAWIQEKLD